MSVRPSGFPTEHSLDYNRMMSIIHLSVFLMFWLPGACLGCISTVTVDFSTLNKMFKSCFENKILNQTLVALTWVFFLFACLLQFDKPGAREGDYPDMAKEAGADLYRLLVIHRYQILIFIVFVLL